jgi:hypothetical protein
VRLAVISDLHIGADEFDRNAPGFVDFLRFLEDDHDEIILLGDVHDSPTGTKSSRSTSIRSGRERRKPTCGSPIASRPSGCPTSTTTDSGSTTSSCRRVGPHARGAVRELQRWRDVHEYRGLPAPKDVRFDRHAYRALFASAFPRSGGAGRGPGALLELLGRDVVAGHFGGAT